ncbi:MAG: nuclear transport factor 2 family protein [Caldilineaceae bacterium]
MQREYEASQLAGDPDWIALWAEDGVQMPPGSHPVVGKAAIDARDRAWIWPSNEYSEFIIDNEEVEVSGDLAFARGTFTVTVTAKSGGDPMRFGQVYDYFPPAAGWNVEDLPGYL